MDYQSYSFKEPKEAMDHQPGLEAGRREDYFSQLILISYTSGLNSGLPITR
jgi:hypothetical protein